MPPIGDNTLITPQLIAREALMIIRSNSAFLKKVNTQHSEDFKNRVTGDTIMVKKPAKYSVRTGRVANIQSSVQEQVPITLEQFGCDMEFSTAELTLSIEKFSKNFIQPAMAPVVGRLDSRLAQLANEASNVTGEAASGVTAEDILNAGAILTENGVPDMSRCVVLTPQAEASLVPNFQNLYNPNRAISKTVGDAKVGDLYGFDWSRSNRIIRFDSAWSGNALTRGAQVAGGTILLKGLGNAALTIPKGTILKIGVGTSRYKILEPQEKHSQDYDQAFVVTREVRKAAGTGNVDLPIYPNLIPLTGAGASRARATVRELPADGVAVTAVLGNAGSVRKNIAFHSDALGIATVDMIVPGDVDEGEMVKDEETGLSIRYLRSYDVTNDRMVTRLDILAGFASFYPEWMCVIRG